MRKSDDKMYGKDIDNFNQLFEKIDEIFFEFTWTEITPTIYNLFDKVIRMNENYKDKIQAMIEELFLTILNIEQPTTTLLLSLKNVKIAQIKCKIEAAMFEDT